MAHIYDSNLSFKKSHIDTIGSLQICILATLPLLSSLTSLLIPYHWKTDSTSIVNLLDFHPSRNTTAKAYISQVISHNILSLGFVQSALTMSAVDLIDLECISAEKVMRTSIFITSYATDASDDGLWLTSDHVQMKDTVLCGGWNFSTTDSHRFDTVDVQIPLSMQGFDAPMVVGATDKWIVFKASFDSPGPKISMDTLPQSAFDHVAELPISLTLTTQNIVYSLVAAVLALMLAAVTTILWCFAATRIVHAMLAGRSGQLHVMQESEDDGPLSLLCCSWCRAFASVQTDQYLVLLLLSGLLMWQNPVRSVCILFHFFQLTSLTDSLLLLAGLSSALASPLLLFSFSLFIGGLRYNRTGLRTVSVQSTPRNADNTVLATSADPMQWATPAALRGDFIVTGSSATSLADNRISNNSSELWFQASRPPVYSGPRTESKASEQQDDFWIKVVLLVLTWALTGLYWCLKFPALLFGHEEIATNGAYQAIYALAEVALVLLVILWVALVLSALYSTASGLRATKYLRNRLKQIAYVMLFTQINLGIVVHAAILFWTLYSSDGLLIAQLQYGNSPYLWLCGAVSWLNYFGGLRSLVSSAPLCTPNMELFLFVSFLVYCTVYFESSTTIARDQSKPIDPQHETQSAVSRGHWSFGSLTARTGSKPSLLHLERYLPLADEVETASKAALELRRRDYQRLKRALIEQKFNVFVKRYLTKCFVVRDNDEFCLETACLLLEASYQSYFTVRHPSNDVTPAPARQHVVTGPMLDLSRLALVLKNTFRHDALSTFGYLGECEAESCAVVAFRGSTLANITADFRFNQIPLPELRHPRSFFINAIRGHDPASANSFDQSALSDDDLENMDRSRSDSYQNPVHSADTASDEESGGGVLRETDINHISINQNSVYDQLQAVGAAIPIMQLGFPRVHAGFWESYASIREQFLAAAVHAIVRHRRRQLSEQVSGNSVQPSLPSISSAGRESRSGMDSTPGIEMTTGDHGYSHSKPAHQTQQSHDLHEELLLDLSDMAPLRFHITGHSLGGAMAVLAALDLATNMKAMVEAAAYEDYFNARDLATGLQTLSQLRAWTAPVITVYNYGCPRIGNLSFARLVCSSVPSIFRVQVNGDLVAMVPKLAGLYRHLGDSVIVDDEETGGMLINPSFVEQVFLRRTTGTLANHSLDRYRSCLEACFEADELRDYLEREFIASSRTHEGVSSSSSGQRCG